MSRLRLRERRILIESHSRTLIIRALYERRRRRRKALPRNHFILLLLLVLLLPNNRAYTSTHTHRKSRKNGVK
jgi:hypothetical protein